MVESIDYKKNNPLSKVRQGKSFYPLTEGMK